MTRWSLSIPEETDRAVRTFLARNGGKKGDLSRFVDEAVRRRMLDLTVSHIKDRNTRYDPQETLNVSSHQGHERHRLRCRKGDVPARPVVDFPVPAAVAQVRAVRHLAFEHGLEHIRIDLTREP